MKSSDIFDENDLVYRLLKRAEIRRSIPRGIGEYDRISTLLEEAAVVISAYRKREGECKCKKTQIS